MHRRPPLTATAGPTARTALTARAGTALLVGVVACACSSPPAVSAAPQASDPACSSALATLPATVLGKARTPLQVAAAASWGEPAIVLRCGLPEQRATSVPCVSVDDVDWVVDAAGDPIVAITFGRAPAVEVRVPASYGRQNVSAALVDVGAVAAALPKTGHACIG